VQNLFKANNARPIISAYRSAANVDHSILKAYVLNEKSAQFRASTARFGQDDVEHRPIN
jgi:hypothetical protein